SPSRTWTIETPQTCFHVASSERSGQTARALYRSCSGWPAAWVGVGGGGIALGEPDGAAGEDAAPGAGVALVAGTGCLSSPPQAMVTTMAKTAQVRAIRCFM